MPFDGTGFPQQPPGGGGRAPGGRAVSALIVVLAGCLLVVPVSLSALVDVIGYIFGK